MITSSQAAGLIGGQQVMFANQAAFAHQISGTMGFGPPMMGQLQNPFPSGMPSYGVAGWDQQSDMGNRIAGGAALSIPAIASGVSLAGGLMGGAAGWADPFTGVARGFARGAGFAGQGAGATLGGLKNLFATGGMRAGGAALAGGLGTAAMTAVPYYIAGKAIETVAENMYEGVQNIRDVGRMSQQYFQPAWGQAGAGPGGSQGRGAIKQITSYLHELAGEDVMTSMKDMRKLMDTAGQMGMLGGITDVQSFKTKFKRIVDQTKTIAQVLGTSLEEAMPLFATMKQTGTWSPQDIMGTMVSMKALGPAGGQAMMGAMQTGAAMSHAMGGRMGAGAAVGRDMMMNVASMMKAGTLSEEAIMEYTGGQGGAAGQQQVAQGLQQAMIGFSQHPMGQMMLAGLGEVKGNRFTGRMDPELMQKFLRGEVSVDQLSNMGRGKIKNRSTAVSFFNRKNQMGMEMLEQGGMEGVSTAIQQVMERAGYGGADEEVQNRFIQMLTKSDQRLADLVQGNMNDLPRIRMEKGRMQDAALEDSIRQMEYRKTRSWQGFKDALGHAFEKSVEAPIQQAMERFTTDVGDSWDRATRRILGMGPPAAGSVGMQESINLAKRGYLDKPNAQALNLMQASSVQNWVKPGALGDVMINAQRPGGQGLDEFGIKVLKSNDYLKSRGIERDYAMTARGGMLARMGMQVRKGVPGEAEVDVGGGYTALTEDVQFTSRSMWEIAQGASLAGNVGGVPTDEQRGAQDKVNAAVRRMLQDPTKRKKLQELKEKDPEAYGQEMTRLLKQDSEAGPAMGILKKGTRQEEAEVRDLKAVMTAFNELGYQKSSLAADVAAMANAAGIPAAGSIDQAQADAVDTLRAAVGETRTATALQWAAIGGLTGPIGAAVGYAAAKIMGAGSEGLTESELNEVAGSKLSDPVLMAMKGDRSALQDIADRGDSTATKVLKMIDNNQLGEKEKNALLAITVTRGADEQKKIAMQVQKMAKDQGRIEKIGGVRGDITKRIEHLRSVFAEGKFEEGAAGVTALATGGDLQAKEINRLLGGAGGTAGVQVGREAVISGLSEGMNEKQFMGQMDRLRRGGDVFGALDETTREKFKDYARSGGKLDAKELKEIKDELVAVSKSARGVGPGGGAAGGPIGTLEHLLVTYSKAHTDFVGAVSKAVPWLSKMPAEGPQPEDQKPVANPPPEK